VRVGDLVRTINSLDVELKFVDKLGIITAWVRTGGPTGTVWEVLFTDGSTEYWDENALEVMNESR
jgi:hypothetical protein